MKKLIALVLIGLSVGASAADKLDWYECSTQEQLRSCNTCKKTGAASFLAAKNNNFVLLQLNNNITKTFENCRIFDSKNWDCSNNTSTENTFNITQVAMIDGIFRWASTTVANGITLPSSAACAK